MTMANRESVSYGIEGALSPWRCPSPESEEILGIRGNRIIVWLI